MNIDDKDIIPVDIRIIAATNRNLQDMIKNKTFREDLYYRLNVVPITIPPLRERKEDIPPLILNFLNRFNEKYNYNKKISPEAMKILLRYNWSGNIREVENLIERLVVTTNDDIINKQDIIDCQLVSITDYSSFDINKISSYKNIIAEYEKKLLLDIMSKCKSTHEMAEILDLDRSTIRKKFKRLNIRLEFKEE